MSDYDYDKGGCGLLVIMALCASFLYNGCYRRLIPSDQLVQEGFISPSRVEIECENKDPKNKLPETYVNIGDESYLLKEIDGKARLVPYEIRLLEDEKR